MKKAIVLMFALALAVSASAGVVKLSSKKSYQTAEFAVRESRIGFKAAEKASVFSAKKLAKAGKVAKRVLY